MNIIEKIKELFRKNKIKALPETNQEYKDSPDTESKNNFAQRIQCEVSEKTKNVYLENILDEYFKSFKELLDENENLQDYPYNALIRIDAIKDEAYEKTPTSNIYHNLDGTTKEIALSTNAFISETINQSYMDTVRKIADTDVKLSFLLQPRYYNNEVLYSKQYDYIKQNYNEYFLDIIEQNMRKLSKDNNIYIKGIEDTITENKKDREENEK